jgi:hypothetical protein
MNVTDGSAFSAEVLSVLCDLRFFAGDDIKTKSQRSLRKAAENAELTMHGHNQR